MTFMRYEPINILSEINRLFDHSKTLQTRREDGDLSSAATSHWMPAVDIKEDASQFTILADLPGVDKKDISIAMEGHVLTIKGQRDEQIEDKQSNYARVERTRGNFYRSFTLPDASDSQGIAAKMNDGVLMVTIPKIEKARARLIDIK